MSDPRMRPDWRGTKCKSCGERHPGLDAMCSYCKTRRIEELRRERDALKAFRSGVVGWRENDHPEWFCRKTAEYVADLGREAQEVAEG